MRQGKNKDEFFLNWADKRSTMIDILLDDGYSWDTATEMVKIWYLSRIAHALDVIGKRCSRK